MMPCIMAGMDQRDSYLVSGSGMYMLGFSGVSAPRAVFPSLSSGPDARLRGRHGPQDRWRFTGLVVDIFSGTCWLVLLVTIHLELCSSTLMPRAVFLRPLMLDIMAGMDQKDSFM